MNRRRFLAQLGAGAGALALHRYIHAAPRTAPSRLLLIHKPVGTVPNQYDCSGDALSYILEPFADVSEHMTLVEGLEIRKAANTPGEDHGNAIVTFMTGGVPYKPPGSNDAVASRASIDQMFARHPRFSSGVPIPSLQLAADDRALQFAQRVMSYAGPGAPLPPLQSPRTAFARVFGTLGADPLTREQLSRAQAGKQSVLDFARSDAVRLQQRVGAEGRARLELHLDAIREVESVMHRTLGRFDPMSLNAETAAAALGLRDAQHADIGRAHLDLVRASFQCDLTRVACFQWGSMELDFSKVIPGLTSIGYHPLSHYAGSENADRELAAIHRWYNVQTAAFVRTLRDTPDIDGSSLLDNTLVVVWTEMRKGTHTFDNVPIQLFGRAAGRLVPGRRVVTTGHTTNDFWLTAARAHGLDLTGFGDPERSMGLIDGLFEASSVPPLESAG